MAQILVIEDDPTISDSLFASLKSQHFLTERTATAEEAKICLRNLPVDLIILDIMLPDCAGFELLQWIRSHYPATLVLVVTSLGSDTDRVVGLEMGADDYLTKPFYLRECMARVKALLRRREKNSLCEDNALRFEELEIRSEQREALLLNAPVTLTAREFDLLVYLARHAGKVFTRSQLLDAVWGYQHLGYEHTVNTHINRLRQKLRRAQEKPEFIQTVWGVGYRFSESTH